MKTVRELLDTMHAQRTVLLDMLRLCREPRAFCEVDALAQRGQGTGVFGTDTLLRQLEEAGAVERVRTGQGPDGLLWHTTAAGEAELATDDPAARLRDALAEAGHSEDEYLSVVRACAKEGGATLKEIDEAFGEAPKAIQEIADQGARVYPQHAIERLSSCGAIEWTAAKTWKATDLGLALLGDGAQTGGDALAAECRSRAGMYGLLARLYRVEVDAPLLARMAAVPVGAGADGLASMVSYAQEAWEGTVTELAVDYVRAFIGNGVDGHEAAYPFESVYTSERRLLMQEARDEVLAIYLSEGLSKADSWKVGEDHVALELEFMQTMAARTADALDAGDQTEARRCLTVQDAFLKDHLGSWGPTFTAEVRRHARTDFYQGLAHLTDEFLAADAGYLDELVSSSAAA